MSHPLRVDDRLLYKPSGTLSGMSEPGSTPGNAHPLCFFAQIPVLTSPQDKTYPGARPDGHKKHGLF